MGSHPVVVVPFCLSGISMYSVVVFKPHRYFILSKTSQLVFFLVVRDVVLCYENFCTQ